jgi:hypothetical protein
VNNNALSNISSLINLNKLKLDGCRYISDEGFSYLSSLTKITELGLSELSFGQQITNEGFSHLSSLVNITSLDLFSSGITNLIPISKLVKINCLSIACCDIAGNGVSHLSSLTNISKLDMSHDSLSNQDLSYISPLTSIQILEIVNCELLTGYGLWYLSTLTNMTVLKIIFEVSECNILNDELFALSSLRQLISLDLHGCDLSDGGLSPLSSLTNITSLDISGTDINNTGLIDICLMTKIEHLNLSSNKITYKGLFYLKTLTNMKSLDLSRHLFIDKGLSHLSLLKKLETLRLNYVDDLSDLGFRDLRFLTNLKILEIIKCPKITDSGFSSICKTLKSLNSLSMSWTETYKCLKNIIKLVNLKEWKIDHQRNLYPLNIFGRKVVDEELPADVLNKLINLNNIEIPSNMFEGKKGVKGLAYVRSIREKKGWGKRL